VVACGGGVVLNQINVDRLKKQSVIVYLTASPEVILMRPLSESNESPLLVADDKAGEGKNLLEFRQPF